MSMRTVELVNILLKDAGSLEKIIRLVQYATKLLKWYYHTQSNISTSKKMLALSGAMAMTRKVMRFPKSLDQAININNTIKALMYNNRSLALFLQLVIRCCSLGYFFFDHFIWLHRVSLTELAPDALKRIQSLSDVSWVGECFFSIIALSIERWVTNPNMDKNDKDKNLRNLVRNLVDLPLTIHFWKPEWVSAYPEGLFGLSGTISSLMSLYEMWPSSK
jgi:hypothetical protein